MCVRTGMILTNLVNYTRTVMERYKNSFIETGEFTSGVDCQYSHFQTFSVDLGQLVRRCAYFLPH